MALLSQRILLDFSISGRLQLGPERVLDGGLGRQVVDAMRGTPVSQA
jgi:hypothetical protein